MSVYYKATLQLQSASGAGNEMTVCVYVQRLEICAEGGGGGVLGRGLILCVCGDRKVFDFV